MKKLSWLASWLGLALVVAGCTPGDSTGASGSGGSSNAGSGGQVGSSSGGATSSSGGATSSSGGATSSGGSGSGGSGTGGAPAGTGGGASGGAGGRGGAASLGGAPGTAGATTMGSGGAAGSSPAVPSAGCGKGGRPAGGVVTVANDHIYNFPASYDGMKPMPLVMALHANGNPNTQLQGLTNGTRLDTNFVRAFPKSAGAGWVIGTDAARLTTIYNDLLANYCIDTSRTFLTGHSSGAQMVVQMLCVTGGEKRFKAVAPVAASKYCAKIMPIPVMYIQGMKDAMRNNMNGIDVVDFFTSSNMCGTMTVADMDVPMCNSMLDNKPVTPGCVTYQGCTDPTIWCSHNDNSYNTTDGNMHGWPCFASNAMADFFLGLP